MKRLKSTRASVLQITLSAVLIASSAILLTVSVPSPAGAKVNQAPSGAVSGGCIGVAPAHLLPAFASDYSCASLGSVPGLPATYGGLTLKYDDTNTLLIGGAANGVTGRIYQIGVVRDANMHITGFSGSASLYPDANSTIGSYNDGGVVFGPGNVLFVTRYPFNELEQTKPGSNAPDKVIGLTALGIAPSVGSIGFVPAGFPGEGQMKVLSYGGGGWYTATFSPDGAGTYDITATTLGSQIDGGPEGIAFVPPGSLVFPPNSVLVAQFVSGKVITAPLDSNGDPIMANAQDFIAQLGAVEGAFIDPVTGDFLFSTFGGGNQIIRVGGFAIPTTPTPTPTPVPSALTISGAISSCPNPSAAPVSNVTLTVTGSASGSTLSDGSGSYALPGLPSGGSYIVTPNASPMTPGASGALINTLDALAVDFHYINVAPLPPGCQKEAAEVNGNGIIDTLDVVAIQRFFIGRTFGIGNAGKFVFHPANRSYSGIVTDQTGQDYDSVLIGDVVTTPPGAAQRRVGDELLEQIPMAVEVALPRIGLRSRSNGIAGVSVSAIDSRERLVGFQGDFTFDERAVTFEAEPVRSADLTNGWSVVGNVLDGPGPIRTLRVSGLSTDLTPLSGSGTLFELLVKRVNNASRRAELTPSNGVDRLTFFDRELKAHSPAVVPSK
jgi:hypothetical protein